MAKIGRNQPCPCSGGKKFKYCCGRTDPKLPDSRSLTTPQSQKEKPLAQKRYEARQLIIQQQQGMGRPFVSTEMNGIRGITVGDKTYFLTKQRTVSDFLSEFLKHHLEAEWGDAELNKPLEERHTSMQWYDAVCRHGDKHLDETGKLSRIPFYGVMTCYLGVANNLFLLKQNVALHDHLLKRLRDPRQFQGAYYELIVFSAFIRAGFTLELVDEQAKGPSRPEFYATSPITGKTYWVEAKMRSVKGINGQVEGRDSDDPTDRSTKLLNDALAKENPHGYERMIFIDLNAKQRSEDRVPYWVKQLFRRFKAKEKDLLETKKAYVFVTNYSYHRYLDAEKPLRSAVAYGLGIPDFAKPRWKFPSQKHKEKRKYIDAMTIFDYLGKYPQIPPSFDGELICERNGDPPRLLVGDQCDFPERGVKGTVVEAFANPDQHEAKYIVRTADGTLAAVTETLTEQQALDYKAHPEAFFGVIQKLGGSITDLEAFELMIETHKNTTKEEFLYGLKTHPQVSDWKDKTREELRDIYCDLMLTNTYQTKFSAEADVKSPD